MTIPYPPDNAMAQVAHFHWSALYVVFVNFKHCHQSFERSVNILNVCNAWHVWVWNLPCLLRLVTYRATASTHVADNTKSAEIIPASVAIIPACIGKCL